MNRLSNLKSGKASLSVVKTGGTYLQVRFVSVSISDSSHQVGMGVAEVVVLIAVLLLKELNAKVPSDTGFACSLSSRSQLYPV